MNYGLRARRHNEIASHLSNNIQKRTSVPLKLAPSIFRPHSYDKNRFRFLNREKGFGNCIQWDFSGFGRLWNYNLNYFDFLNQREIDIDCGLGLIRNFINASLQCRTCMEPYPISLRSLNWIKFLNQNKIRDQRIDSSIYAQVQTLANNLEYHLLGNHLLENGIALFFASFYFKDSALFRKAEKILSAELEEQILTDGGHFELSPMYHQIMLDRILDCINLAQNNPAVYKSISNVDQGTLLKKMKTKASIMLGWLREMTFTNGDIALVNDAAFKIAPNSAELIGYANRLGVVDTTVPLKESGYRKIRGKNFEALIDIGNIGPDYIPGHAHADTFNFLLYVHDKPVIMDTGTSTYDNNELRHFQRSTNAHNTVEMNGLNQSEVWGSFRVARRARVTLISETKDQLCACHDGYGRLPGKPIHQRTWHFLENRLEIQDEIRGPFKEAVGRFHFHPNIKPQVLKEDNSHGVIKISEAPDMKWQILKGSAHWTQTTYHPLFNLSQPNTCLELRFDGPTAGIRFFW
jgi:hypothetical protein